MISNFPYLVKEFNASTCEPDVHAMLAANAARIAKINIAVSGLLLTVTTELASGFELRNKIMSVPTNNVNLAKLTKPIGRLTDAASAQTSRSRKLMVVLNKIVRVKALSKVALSVIQSACRVPLALTPLLCFHHKDAVIGCCICFLNLMVKGNLWPACPSW